MTLKQWLNRGRKIDMEIQILDREFQRARDAAIGVVYYSDSDKVQTSRRNVSEDKMIELASYSRELQRRKRKLIKTKQEIFDAIGIVDDTTLRQLLMLRYVEGLTWEDIAEEMHYSRQHIHRLHIKALKKLKMLQNVLECYG